MKQDMNDTFKIAFRAMFVAAMTLLTGSTATAQVHVNGSVYGGGNLANVGGTVVVNMSAGTVDKDVYGGGALANTNTSNWDFDGGSEYEQVNVIVNKTVVTGMYTKEGDTYTKITENIKAAEGVNYYKKIGTWATTGINTTTGATTYTTTVNLTGGTINGDAYGGGLGRIAESVHYTQEEADAYNSEHNLSSGDEGFKTTADWLPEVKATVYGDINVILGKDDASSATKFYISKYTDEQHAGMVKSGRVFGCNNLNGSPQGNVTVTVWKTVKGNIGRSETADKNNTDATYEVAAVYGGGNLANYTTTGKKTHVIINGCDATSINYVYGGGNAAAVPQASVDVNAAYEIGYVFGGGNGKDDYTLDGSTWQTNPGANVNGNANTMLFGGTIHEAFGGSNEKGRITGSVSINSQKGDSESANYCALKLGKLYGAGKNADIDGDLIVVMGCMPGEEDPTTEVYGGAENANVKGDVELTITSGSFRKVFGGNNQSGAIFGHIKLNIEESGCTPIIIDELYLGGYNAPYSVYGYKNTGTADAPIYVARTHKEDGTAVFFDFNPHTKPNETSGQYDDPELNIISATRIGKVFGGGLGSGAIIYGNPIVNINQTYPLKFASYDSGTGTTTYAVKGETLGQIGGGYTDGSSQVEGGVFGGGNEAAVHGNTTINIGNKTNVDWTVLVLDADQNPVLDTNGKPLTQTITETTFKTVHGANITGNVYGGGNLADVTGNTQVNVCTVESGDSYAAVIEGDKKVIIARNVYGGGKGKAEESGDRAFYCEEAMVGLNDTNSETNNNAPAYANYGTHVRIGNGTVNGSVYGGGEIGRVEFHTEVIIGFGVGTGATTKSPVINGSVFGAGKGTNTHGYSGLVRGDSRVTIQGDAKIGQSVYGGGEMASVGKYEVVDGLPKNPLWGGKCTVTIQGYAEIGPDNMQMTKDGGPDDTGHVFGAGKGTLPYENVTGTPWSMQTGGKVTYDESYTPGTDGLEYEAAYYKFIQSLGLASNSDVTIGGNAFVKGSVYGGSENGYLQANTHVTIAGGQIGEGLNKTAPYADADFIDPSTTPVTTDNALATCATWTYDKVTTGKPYDKYAAYLNSTDNEYYYDAEFTKSSKGGAPVATDGHTYYGNVFGGGRGVVPFAAGKWHRAAGSVAGNTQVDITAGHILSSVYGGNENTDVGSYALGSDGEPTTTLEKEGTGTCTINISGGTVGVPRTKEQIEDNPVIGNVFGAGKGDKRVLFNTWTNVGATSVNISGTAKIYGSVFGGGEDGHVIGNAVSIIGGTVTIGSTGISGADGNVFGGGRGSETALTAGVVGGNVNLTIDNGKILGSVYGGGRLASVGTNFVNPENTSLYGVLQTPAADHGNTVVTINGGTIGLNSTGVNGNIYGGSKGTTSDFRLGIVRSTTINMTGGTAYASVYGGGELAQVVGSHTTSDQTLGTEINISGGTIGTPGKGGATWGNVYAGGKGNTTHVEAGLVKTNTKANISQAEGKTTTIYHNIYGGGAYGSVGTYTYNKDNDGNLKEISGYTSDGKAEIYVTGGTIGTDGKENGMIFGSSRGDVGAPNSIHDKLAWVYDTQVTINGGQIKGSVYGGGENGHNYHDAVVNIQNGTIGINNNETITYKDDPNDADKVTYTGKDYNYPYRGNVYGGGCGTDKYYENPNDETHDGNGQLYNSKAGIVQGNAIVHISAGNIVRNVYGAGAMGSVGTMTKDNDDLLDISSGGKTTIEISGGTVGVDGTDNGNVFGAARGDETTKQTDVALVKTTDVTVSGDATVWGNVYGGGQIGCVGTFTERVDDGKYIWTSDAQNLNGLTKVSITGGETKGHVFGAGKGSAVTFKCEKAMVKKTQVSVSNGKVDKNVYGGGEIGRVEEDTDVKIGVGDGTCNPTILGSVYGAGAGLETHGYSALVRHNTTVTVDGGATIGQSVYGGGEIASVGRYGLDEHKMPEILLDGGYCYVKVQGSATIGSNTVQGNVFGACKGVVPHFDKTNADRSKRSRRMTVYSADDFPDGAKIDVTTGNASSTTSTGTTWEYYDESVTSNLVWEYFQEEDGYNKYLETLALATHPEVTIDGGATVNGSVYGGGEMGLTKGSVMVNILGGTITEDVYGGGALANTNTTSAVGVLDNAGIPQKTNGQYQTTTVYPKTTVNLLGGSMRDAYGGGLGQLALAAQGTEGQTGYQAAVPAIEAKVNGDVKVNLNGLQAATDMNTTILNSLTTGSKLDAVGSGYIVKSSAKGAVVNRVFGCNNLNGTPTKKVQVYVFGTQKSDKAQLNAKAARNTDTYDVQAVYGGGNLAPYVPADALLDYEQNKATVDAARPEVYIDGCDLTSIKQVYGGGNAASVPATFVEIRRCYEIDEVFGGGNGYDDYSLVEHGETKWYKNPGANVGYYTGYYTNYATYSNYETRTSGGGSGTDSDPYLAVVNPIYDGDEIVVVNGVEKNMKETRLAAKNIQYGSGIARLEVKGGTIHTSYGGSNSKGNVRAKLSSAYSAMFDDCEMQVAQSYGGGKNAYSDAETDMVADCAKGVKEMFGGAKDADMNGDINMLITNGSSLERVFGGNNTSGAVNGSITITLQEGGCEPIKIGELYAGGFLAPYSVYGYKKTNGVYDTEEVEYIDTDGTTKTRAQRIPLESGTRLYKDPRINVISATSIGNIFGGGYQAKLVGNPHINVNMTTGFVKVTKTLKAGTTDEYIYKDAAGNEYAAEKVSEVSSDPSDLEAKSYIATTDLGTIGNIYGGGNMADIVGDTYVEIGTGTEHNDAGELVAITPARNGAKISGNVFGGGKGKADSFTCEKAMVTGANGTNIIIGNGTIGGTVYGGGEIGRVEANTNVTIGLEEGTGEPVIEGNVFGAGRGAHTHGYAALVRGNTTVTVQGEAKVRKSVYGGGEIASVGKYNIADAAYHAEHPEVLVGMPYSLVSDNKGICNVIVKGNAVIGPEGSMEMKAAGGPDDIGHVFGAGKGVLPYHDIDNHIITGDPWRVKPGDEEHPTGIKEIFNEETFSEAYYTNLYGSDYNKKLYNYLADYLRFIETLALTTQTEVTIGGNAFVKGSVYGGSENGHVQHNTHVTIQDYCQIGHSAGVSRRFTEDEWRSEDLSLLKECASWDYVATEGAPYDPLATSAGTYDYTDYPFVPAADRDSRPTSDGGKPTATDGHTYYGNVFGGGSGVVPYAPGRWHREAGSVGGNTQVDITGGHIMTSVYGGNEQTDVGTYELDPDNDFQPTIPKSGGKCTINMRGGTLGVPRTPERMKTHPVTCYLFGAGKGDQRIFFNTWTNVINTEVNISGTARIYGSTFGGGEDGHVILNAVTNISGDKEKVIIGTTGTSYVDGNVFGGGRGFSGEAQTAGTVGGNVEVNISGGTMLGSIYGGGRLASVGTLFTAPDDPNYGNFVEDGGGKTYGHVAVNISGGTIGNTVGNAESGNVFGGSMGRLNLLNGNINPIWPKMAQVKETTVTISGDAVIKRNVYGGGELGTVRDNATVNINGGTVNRDVYGAGYGSKDYETKTKITVKIPKEGVTNPTSASDYDDVSYVFTPMIFAGCVGQNTYVNIAGGKVRKSVYGGGEMASVGIMDCRVKIDNNATDPVYTEGTDKYVYEHFHSHLDETNGFALSWPFHFENSPGYFGATHVNITGGRIGVANGDTDINTDNGDVYGGGKGIAGEYKNYVYCANVGSAEVTIDYPAGNTATPQNYMTNADIECIAGAVYGGAENGHVMGDTKLTLKNGLIGHSMYGGGSGKGKFSTTLLKIGSTSEHYTREIYSITAGKVFGNSTVEMSGGTVVRNVYGGGNMGSVGKGNYAGGLDDYSTAGYGETLSGNLWDNANDYSKAFLGSGKCTVNITGGTVGYIDESDPSNSMYPWNSTASLPYGNVFGGCRGESAPNIVETPRYLYSPEFFVGYANETEVTIGKTDGSGPTILGSVYGGGMDGHIRRDASVTILGGEIGVPFTEANKTKVKTSDPNDIQWLARGNVYGSGSGIGKYKYDFDYDGKYESTVKYNNGRATVDTKEEDYSTSAGSVTRFTTVDIKGGTIHRNVYGGGSLSSIGAPKIGQSYDPYHPGDSEHSSEVGKQSLNKVTISGGQIGDADCLTSGYGGEVNGGSRGELTFENSLADPSSFANSVWTDVIISDNANVLGNVFGGGEAGIVKHDTDVKMQGGTVGTDVYGGGDMADVNGNTTVSLTGGTVTRDVFGGARGTATIAANVGGDVLVDLNGGVDPAKKGAVVKRNIFGANNVNGTPQGHVLVYVHGTQNENTDNINTKVKGEYDVLGVYGGGNQSDYVPTDTKQSTEVIIEGCDLTSIDEVYGGGYGAATPATSVLVKGTKIINNVYGGGYGASTDTYTNPGANVGYRSNKAPYDQDQGTGKAIVQLMAGTVNNVYGGSNTLGDIRGGSSVTNVANDGSAGCCEKLTVGEIYGGGKQADMYGGAEIILGCMPNDWIGAIYGGAENANVGNDVSLTLTSGKFGRVFGGNKSGGTIDGYIEVNIEENPVCSTPIIIGGLYGGGNEAPYAVPARYFTNNPNYQSPRVNVRAFTSIGNIYGGGFGASATVTGNPLVNINEVQGGREYAGEDKPLEDGTTVKLYARKADGKMGVIGNVFGGGNAAKVIGNTNVMIGTEAEQEMESLKTTDATTGTVTVVKKPVLGADIQGNVYGAGNNAEVTGHTNVVIGKKAE